MSSPRQVVVMKPSGYGVRSRDVGWLALLWVLVVVSWCLATGKVGSAPWNMPTAYTEPTYGDFLGTCGYLHSLRGAAVLPVVQRTAPELGAPDGVNWSATIMPDKIVVGLFWSLTRLLGTFAGYNVGLLVGHLAAASSMYLVARLWGRSEPSWSFVAALGFGLAPYLFAESPHHINCQYVWHLPMFPIVWTWIAVDPGIQWRSRRFWQVLTIGFVAGLFSPYFTFVFCQITLLGGAALAWRARAWKRLTPALAVVGATVAAFFIVQLDTVSHRMSNAPLQSTPLVAHREYRWMDIYGFKVIDLFIPSFTHRSDALAKFGLTHRQASVLNDEEGCAYLGLLGIACLLWLVASTMRALLDRKLAAVPIQAWWVLWIVLFFNTGGLNSMIAAFTGFTLFRTATRYSVVVLVIALLYAAKRLSAWQRDAAARYPADILRIGTLTAVLTACLLVLWDQVPRGPATAQTTAIATLVESDREFVGRLESALPDEAMVFQLPVMDGTPLPGVPSADHFRPTLYGTSLHWSHGALPGTKTLQWQQSVQRRLIDGAAIDQQAQQVRFNIDNLRQAVDEMRSKGFAAMYVNRNGFPDRGKGLFDALLELGYDTPPIYSPAGDLACIILGDRVAR